MKNKNVLKYYLLAIISTVSIYGFCQTDSTEFANGADIGWLSQMEASGYKFYNDSGVQENCMQILKEKGINALRFRVWVNPTSKWCSKKDVATMAHRADSMGFKILIDFHYSDTWADPSHQTKPAAWATDSISKLYTDIYNHTYNVLDTLKQIGIIPKWVQIGNETNNGMLWPDGNASNHMNYFANMILNGYNAVKAIDSSILVIVHLSNGYDNSMFRWMFDGLKKNGAKWDIIGMSQYPYWANLPWATDDNKCLANMKDMIARYNKKVMIVETGYIYNQAIAANNFLLDLIAKTKSVNGLGVFYWEPECYNWQGYNLGAWNANGRPSLAMDAFLGIKHTDSTSIIPSRKISDLNIYPNPLDSNLQSLSLSGVYGKSAIKILNINGNVLFERNINNNEKFSNLNLNSGVYFVQIDNAYQKVVKTLVVR